MRETHYEQESKKAAFHGGLFCVPNGGCDSRTLEKPKV